MKRISGRLGLPYSVGIVVLGTLPAIAGFTVGNLLAGVFWETIVGTLPIIPLFIVCLYGAEYTVQRVKNLDGLAQMMDSDVQFKARLRTLCSLKRVLPVWLVLSVFIVLILTYGQTSTGPTTPLSLVFLLPATLYTTLAASTIVWVFGYSMYSLYKVGKGTLKLRPFGTDRTLGLRPFGLASLQIAAVYLGVSAILIASILVGGGVSLIALVSLFSFPLLAVPFFFLPLTSVHGKLVEAKSREMEWISRRYADLFQEIKSNRDARLDDSLKTDLAAFGQLQRDVQQVHSWPFDIGIIVRLAAITLSLAAILLSAVIRDLFHF